MPRPPKRRKYNLYLEVYPVEYQKNDLIEGYEPVRNAKPIVRFNFILPDKLQRGYIVQQVRSFVKALENGTAAFTIEEGE